MTRPKPTRRPGRRTIRMWGVFDPRDGHIVSAESSMERAYTEAGFQTHIAGTNSEIVEFSVRPVLVTWTPPKPPAKRKRRKA